MEGIAVRVTVFISIRNKKSQVLIPLAYYRCSLIFETSVKSWLPVCKDWTSIWKNVTKTTWIEHCCTEPKRSKYSSFSKPQQQSFLSHNSNYFLLLLSITSVATQDHSKFETFQNLKMTLSLPFVE